MKEFSCTITNPTGIDTRYAGLLAKIAKNYDDTVVTITKDGSTAKTSQLMRLIGLGIKQGDTISVALEGDSEDAAVAAMEQFFKMKKFTYTITNPTGIDTRCAGLLNKMAKNYADTMITIAKDGNTAKAGQLMKLISLGIKQGDTKIRANQGTIYRRNLIRIPQYNAVGKSEN